MFGYKNLTTSLNLSIVQKKKQTKKKESKKKSKEDSNTIVSSSILSLNIVFKPQNK